MPISDTKQRILTAAEELFSRNGYAATSMRELTEKANVNLSAVSYHFGSKKELFMEIVRREFEPLREERLKLLQAARAQSGGEPVSVETIIRAFLMPLLKRFRSDTATRRFMRMVGRAFSEEPALKQEMFTRFFKGTSGHFIRALQEALPGHRPEEIYWRFHFTVGTMVGALADPDRLDMISGGACDSSDLESMVQRLISYVIGGFKAPILPLVELS